MCRRAQGLSRDVSVGLNHVFARIYTTSSINQFGKVSHNANRMRPRRIVPLKRSADTQEAAWVAQEDQFVLKQAKKKAAIRVKEGRARPIDWLAVILRIVDPERDLLDDDFKDSELDVVDPDGILEGLDPSQLSELEKDIDIYLALERSQSNRNFWKVSDLSAFLDITDIGYIRP